MTNVIKKIEDQINNNKLIIYIKGTPESPMCGFSAQVINILTSLKIEYTYVNILKHNDIRTTITNYSNWPTFPQVYYNKKLIGGADIIIDLYKNNKLKKILTK